MFLLHPRVKVSIVGSLRDWEVACSASDRQGSNFESCVWRTVSSQSSHHPQEVFLAQFSLYVHKGGLKPDSFYFVMSLDVIIRRNISFVGCTCCILIIATTESNKISCTLFIALQWRRRCISSSISFDSHLVHIRWFFGVIGLLNRPLSICRSCELIRYLAIAVMRWFPLMCKIYGSTQKYFFTNAYVRSSLELSISFLHRCVNILTIDYLNESMNLFVSPM